MTKQRYMKKWRAAHRKGQAAYMAVYSAAHRKERAEYRAAHRKEIAKCTAEYRAAHLAETAWRNMHLRAGNTDGNHSAYANVKVCARWSGPKGKANFIADMGQPPKGTTLSRFGDIGNYKPSNCAWHTKAQQVAEAKKKRLTNEKTNT